MSRKPHEPDAKSRATVQGLVGCGITLDDTAKIVGIDRKTLSKHYKVEISTGHLKANASVAQSLFKKATGGNVVAQIFWLKARAGWKDKFDLEVSGNPDAPLVTGLSVSFVEPQKLTYESTES